MYKFFLFIFFLLLVKNSIGQNSFSFTDTIFEVNSVLLIEALDYSNEIEKYFFNENKVDSLASLLLREKSMKVEVVCNSDYNDSPLLAMMITFDQASEIRNYLVRSGVEGTRVAIYGKGDMNLLYSEKDAEKMSEEEILIANKKNRRIEVNILEYSKTIEKPKPKPKPKSKSKNLQSYPSH